MGFSFSFPSPTYCPKTFMLIPKLCSYPNSCLGTHLYKKLCFDSYMQLVLFHIVNFQFSICTKSIRSGRAVTPILRFSDKSSFYRMKCIYYARSQTPFGNALVHEALLQFVHVISSIPACQFPVLLLHQEYMKRQSCISNAQAP